LKKSTKKRLVRFARLLKHPGPKINQSFFAFFCSQKEVLVACHWLDQGVLRPPALIRLVRDVRFGAAATVARLQARKRQERYWVRRHPVNMQKTRNQNRAQFLDS
jgi:hypothetical protein